MRQDKADIETLLPKAQEPPPELRPSHAQETPGLILGLPVQLVAGSAYCAGEMHETAIYNHAKPDQAERAGRRR